MESPASEGIGKRPSPKKESLSSLYWKEVLGVDTEKESELKYYAQRTNYLEGGIMITGKAPSKTERKKTSRKQLAATRKQLLSEVNEFKQSNESPVFRTTSPDGAGTDLPSVEESGTDGKSESQRRIEAMLRLTEATTGKEGTPAKRGRRPKKPSLHMIWSWKENLQNFLSGCEVIEKERVFEMTVTLQNASEQESSFCCVLNDGSVSYQVFSDF